MLFKIDADKEAKEEEYEEHVLEPIKIIVDELKQAVDSGRKSVIVGVSDSWLSVSNEDLKFKKYDKVTCKEIKKRLNRMGFATISFKGIEHFYVFPSKKYAFMFYLKELSK